MQTLLKVIFILFLGIHFSFAAEVVQKCKAYYNIFEALEEGGLSKAFSDEIKKDLISSGGYFTRKEMRRRIAQAKWTEHGKKHFPPGGKSAKEIKKLTKKPGRESLYHPDFKGKSAIETLERRALRHTKNCYFVPRTGKSFWKICKMDRVVGFDGGEGTKWMRVEMTANNTLHGHPMSVVRVKRYVKSATE